MASWARGTMGNGIAHVFAKAGYSVMLVDVEQTFLERALSTIGKNLEREVAKGKLTAEAREAALQRITPVIGRAPLATCDLVVEAATEQFKIKAELFQELDRLCHAEVILASNTSSISITKLGAVTKRPQQVIGMHFFNPVPMMKLVEVIRGLATSQETFQSVFELAKKLDKTPVEVNDSPGFVSNRVLMPLLNEAMYTVMEGVATAEAVDEVFKLGMAHPMGPLTLADFIGLDVCLDVMRVMQDGLGDPKYRPCPLLIKMVDAGLAGEEDGPRFLSLLISTEAQRHGGRKGYSSLGGGGVPGCRRRHTRSTAARHFDLADRHPASSALSLVILARGRPGDGACCSARSFRSGICCGGAPGSCPECWRLCRRWSAPTWERFWRKWCAS